VIARTWNATQIIPPDSSGPAVFFSKNLSPGDLSCQDILICEDFVQKYLLLILQIQFIRLDYDKLRIFPEHFS